MSSQNLKFNSKPELSRKALPLLFTGLLVATFFGGAIRAFFSPRQIEVWVSRTLEKENPPLHLRFAEGRLSLSKSGIPRLGLVFDQVHIQPKDYCKLNAELYVQQLYLPIEVLDFLKGKLRFREIEIEGAEMNLGVGNCPSQAVAVEAQPDLSEDKAQAAVEPLEELEERTPRSEVLSALNFFHHRWAQEMKNTTERLEGLRISSLKLHSGEKPLAEISNIRLDTRSAEKFTLTASFQVQRFHGLVESFSPTELSLEVDPDVLKFRLSQQIREGRVVAKGEVLLISLLYNLNLDWNYVPTRPLWDLTVRNAWLEDNLNWPREAWVSGSLQASGGAEEWKLTRVQLKDGKIEGDLGVIHVPEAEFRPFQNKKWLHPVRLQLDGLKMDSAFEMLGYKKLKGLFQSFGVFQGEFVLTDSENMDLIGDWRDLALRFSHHSVRHLQKFSFRSQLARKDGRWSGKVSQIEIEDGNFEGELSFNLTDRDWSGPLQVRIEDLQFSQPVQSLMFGGRAEAFEIYGQGQFLNSGLEKAEASVGVPGIDGQGWKLSGLKAQLNLKPEALDVKLNLKELQVESSHYLYPEMKPLYLDQKASQEQIRWSAIEMTLRFHEGIWKWSKAMAKDTRQKVIFSSEGQWSDPNGFDGWISVDFPVLKLLKWELSGSVAKPRLQPSAKMLRELARKSPGFNIQTFLAPQKAQATQLETLGEKVLETAKKILPEKEGEGGDLGDSKGN